MSLIISGRTTLKYPTRLGASEEEIVQALFSAGEQGVWYDPSDFSTMFQDAAGTIPVTDVGQPVGRILDKSGRGNHATQGTPTSRPILQQDENNKYYLLFDGSDDWLNTASIDFTATDKMTVFAGVRKLSDAASGDLVNMAGWETNTLGKFTLLAPGGGGTNKFFFSAHNGSIGALTTSSTYNAPITAVLTGEAIGTNRLRINGSLISTSSAVSASFINAAIYIGRRANGSLPYNGRLYSLIVRGAETKNDTIGIVENYINRKII